MTGAALLSTILGAVAAAAGLGLFTLFLVGASRGTRSANLEYGIMPAMLLAPGLGIIDWMTGWPGWSGWAYPVVFILLAVVFCGAILRAGRRDGTGS